MNSYLSMLINIFNYKQSTSRNDFWSAVLINFVVSFGILLINFGFYMFFISSPNTSQIIKMVYLTINLFIILYLSLATLSMSIRRLHAINKSGWWILTNCIPVIGFFIYLYLMTQPDAKNIDYFDEFTHYYSSKQKNMHNELDKAIEQSNIQILEESSRKENSLGHKLTAKDKIISYTTETDLNSLIFILENETTSSYVEKRLKKSLYIFLSLAGIVAVIGVANLILNLHLAINYPLFIIASVIISYGIYKIDYFMIKSVFKTQQKSVKDAFPLWMSTLEVLIVTNNIPNTLRKSLPSCPKPIVKDLERFIARLDVNPIDKEAYKDFLSQYNIPEIQEIVLDLYQFNFVDKNNISTEFAALHKRLNRISSDTRKRRQESDTFLIGALNSLPLMVVSLYILMISNLLSSAIMGNM